MPPTGGGQSRVRRGPLRPIAHAESGQLHLFPDQHLAGRSPCCYAGAANDTAAQMAAALHFALRPSDSHPRSTHFGPRADGQASGADAEPFQLNIRTRSGSRLAFPSCRRNLDLPRKLRVAGLFVENSQALRTARADSTVGVSTQTQQMIPQLFDPGSIDTLTVGSFSPRGVLPRRGGCTVSIQAARTEPSTRPLAT